MLELRGTSWPAGRRPTVSGVDLRVEPGRPLAIVNLARAESAALFRILLGEAAPASGSVKFAEKPLRELTRQRGGVVRVGPDGAPASGRTLARVLEAAGRDADVQALLSRTGLADLAQATVRQAEPPARVRLAFACALAQKPKLLLLDAPASRLTGSARTQFLLDLREMLADQACVVVLVGGADEALALGGDVAVFDKAGLVQTGPVGEVFAHPRNLAVACATASPALNILPLEMEGGVARMADGARFTPPPDLSLPEAGSCTLAFRPDDLHSERIDARAIRFVARLNGVEESPSSYAHVTFGGAHWLAPRPLAGAGRVVNAFVDRSRLMLFDADGVAI